MPITVEKPGSETLSMEATNSAFICSAHCPEAFLRKLYTGLLEVRVMKPSLKRRRPSLRASRAALPDSSSKAESDMADLYCAVVNRAASSRAADAAVKPVLTLSIVAIAWSIDTVKIRT